MTAKGAMRLAAVGAVAGTILAACSGDSRARFSAFESMPDAVWLYSRPAVFTADTAAADSISRGALVLSLRHTADYPFRNIWVEVQQSLPGVDSTGATAAVSCDTFEITLADPYGKWFGTGMGASRRFNDTLSAD